MFVPHALDRGRVGEDVQYVDGGKCEQHGQPEAANSKNNNELRRLLARAGLVRSSEHRHAGYKEAQEQRELPEKLNKGTIVGKTN